MLNPKHESGVVLLSGGLDSAVCLSIAAQECKRIFPLAFEYGQKTCAREMECARALADYYHTEILRVVRLDFLGQITGAALCQPDQEVTRNNEYVPFRNGIFLAIATALAETVGAEVIYIGSTGGDRICNDNSQQFRDAFETAVAEGTNTQRTIHVSAPLGTLEKVDIVRTGLALGTPLEHTWSCHNNIDTACGQCSNCTSRQAAFETLHRQDPARK